MRGSVMVLNQIPRVDIERCLEQMPVSQAIRVVKRVVVSLTTCPPAASAPRGRGF